MMAQSMVMFFLLSVLCATSSKLRSYQEAPRDTLEALFQLHPDYGPLVAALEAASIDLPFDEYKSLKERGSSIFDDYSLSLIVAGTALTEKTAEEMKKMMESSHLPTTEVSDFYTSAQKLNLSVLDCLERFHQCSVKIDKLSELFDGIDAVVIRRYSLTSLLRDLMTYYEKKVSTALRKSVDLGSDEAKVIQESFELMGKCYEMIWDFTEAGREYVVPESEAEDAIVDIRFASEMIRRPRRNC